MFDFLPAAEPVELAGAPLVQVVAQVKFNSQSTLSTLSGVGLLHDLLPKYPRLLTEQQAVFTATPAGMTTTQIPQWRMTDLENEWAVVVGPEQLAVETNNYESWGAFRERLLQALTALTEYTHPRVQERIGLRYVNHVHPDGDGSYSGRLREELLGLAGVTGWQKAMEASLAQTLLQDEGRQLALRYGTGKAVIADEVFVIDIDCFDERPSSFDLQTLIASFDTLNDAAYRCFSYCLQESFHADLKRGV